MASRAGSKNVKTHAAKCNTQEYFAKMLTNAAEDVLWKRFMESTNEDIAFRAFIRAIEYKRGKPIQPVESDYAPHEEMGFGALPIPDGPRTTDKPN